MLHRLLRRSIPVLATAAVTLALAPAGASFAPVFAAGNADLYVGVSGPSNAYSDNVITYWDTFGNSGPDQATGILLTNAFSSPVTIFPNGSDPTCAQTSSTVIVCGPLTASVNTSSQVRLTIFPSAAGTLVDNLTGTSNESDPNPGNNNATWSVTITTPTTADVSVSKSASPGPYYVGQTFKYYLFFDNEGPATATNVTITDQLPAQLQFVSAEAPCTASGNLVTCQIGTVWAKSLGDGIGVTVMTQTAGTVTNTANITADQPDPNPSNNSYSLTVQIQPEPADVSLSKTAYPGPIYVGQTFNYDLAYSNAGPADATNVTITDQLPSQVQYVSSTPAGCSAVGNLVTCQVGTLYNHSASPGFRIFVQAVAAGTVMNSSSISADQPDNNPSNNSSSVTVQIQPPTTDLALSKTGTPNPVVAGQKETYTITVTNNGPSTATGVVAQDAWSAASGIKGGIAFKSVSTSQGACTQSGAGISCNLGSLASGASATVTLLLQPRSKGTLSDTATVDGNESDPNTANNSSTVLTTVG